MTTTFACETESPAPNEGKRKPGSLLPIEGAYNIRDMGGYRTAGGKTVRWDTVFRSGDLNKLTKNDAAYLEALGIKTVVDFRSRSEKDEAPDTPLATVTETVELPIDTGNVMDYASMVQATAEQNENALVKANRYFFRNCRNEYKTLFSNLQDAAKLPLLFHCSAGKDRAGLAAALFLSCLGVDRETVIADYLLSGGYVAEKYASIVSHAPQLAPLFTVKRKYIEAAFDAIENEFITVEAYLAGQLNVDLSKMKELYLQ
ncbi:MAG: tyrosine-protein phosphatase [Treponema sp.]|jgi:protein-tyrosine phosphatase|nr:tyrosine-protein phosphatase [Treponema sp.]